MLEALVTHRFRQLPQSSGHGLGSLKIWLQFKTKSWCRQMVGQLYKLHMLMEMWMAGSTKLIIMADQCRIAIWIKAYGRTHLSFRALSPHVGPFQSCQRRLGSVAGTMKARATTSPGSGTAMRISRGDADFIVTT